MTNRNSEGEQMLHDGEENGAFRCEEAQLHQNNESAKFEKVISLI